MSECCGSTGYILYINDIYIYNYIILTGNGSAVSIGGLQVRLQPRQLRLRSERVRRIGLRRIRIPVPLSILDTVTFLEW